jgi:hypothetical protein
MKIVALLFQAFAVLLFLITIAVESRGGLTKVDATYMIAIATFLFLIWSRE